MATYYGEILIQSFLFHCGTGTRTATDTEKDDDDIVNFNSVILYVECFVEKYL
jgi:hypothetical protein